jgi:hypothetical protein
MILAGVGAGVGDTNSRYEQGGRWFTTLLIMTGAVFALIVGVLGMDAVGFGFSTGCTSYGPIPTCQRMDNGFQLEIGAQIAIVVALIALAIWSRRSRIPGWAAALSLVIPITICACTIWYATSIYPSD